MNRSRLFRWFSIVGAALTLLSGFSSVPLRADLADEFASPPDAARPWVYWFWLNGNITREGITADLEAMKRVGIGGVLIMEVDQGAPAGAAGFSRPEWRELFKFMVSEAARLGIEVNMNNDAGWCGSGGPWITPELSMQRVVWSEAIVQGGQRFEGVLPQPKAHADYYRDIAVLAMPMPEGDDTKTPFRIPDIQGKASFVPHCAEPRTVPEPPKGAVIPRSSIVDLTSSMGKDGKIAWQAPAGKWLLLRFGHTTTGKDNHPAPQPGRGLECDKFSKAAAEAHFDGLMKKLVDDSPALSGSNKTLVSTHIDSWEVGSQNWTPLMREEFKKRRGYDLFQYLPTFTGRVVESAEVTGRFLWDLRQTVSDLIVENYAGHFRTLSHRNGLRLSIEAYDAVPVDELTFGGQADEPMAEFWSWNQFGCAYSCTEMASAAHVYGNRILGAEAFTANSDEKWLGHPAVIKDLGDWAFCEGINRFVFHRYALQPWKDRAPGMSMGPWGLHYERTQTWWEQSLAWHEYLTRCQFLLRQGLFVADVCYLQAEGAPGRFSPPASAWAGPHLRGGYNFDGCSPEVVLTRMSVKDGRIVLPDGMSYRVLVLPETGTMSPALLRKIRELVDAGATVVASTRPVKAPGLTDYPNRDAEVARMAGELWNSGKLVFAKTAAEALTARGVPPDFQSDTPMRWIHRSTGDADFYFVANPGATATEVSATFRIAGRQPEIWHPDTGRTTRVGAYRVEGGRTTVPLWLEPRGSVFVVFRSGALVEPVVALERDRVPLLSATAAKANIVVKQARYGVLPDPKRTRDVRADVQALADRGEIRFEAKRIAESGDPAYGTVKTLEVEYSANGQVLKAVAQDNEMIALSAPASEQARVDLTLSGDGRLMLETGKAGKYAMKNAGKEHFVCVVPELPKPLEISGAWEVRFAPGRGAPERITLDRLASWSEHADPGVKYFSGQGTYTKTFEAPADLRAEGRRLWLDLGKVEVMAEVTLNGKPCGILWKPPYRMEVTDALKPGANTLEVKVVNLWVNRLIGDEQLPELPERQKNGTLKSWPSWVQENRPDPSGRIAFSSWNLWKKDAALQPSGLLGPVTLTCTARLPATPASQEDCMCK